MTHTKGSWLPTENWTRALAAPVLVFLATGMDRNYQTDLWHHLARGRVMIEDGRLLNADRFTYTVPGLEFLDVNWGWQLLFYPLFALGGLPLVQTVNSLLLAGVAALLQELCRRRSGSVLLAAAISIVSFVGLWQLLLIRPQTLSFLLFVLLSLILESACRQRRWLAAAPVVMALWVNLHGAFPIGLVLIGCYALAAFLGESPDPEAEVSWSFGAIWKRTAPWALCLAASGLATLINPYGWGVYQYVGLTSGRAAGRKIDEWLPPGLDLLVGKVWAASLVLLVLLLARGYRKPAIRELCLIAVFLPLSCGSVRMIAWWLLIVAPMLAAQLAVALPRLRLLDESGGEASVGNALTCGLMLTACVFSLPWLERVNPVMMQPGRSHRVESDLQAVADYLRTRADQGRIFTRFAWGEYLGWSLAPKFQVFMDGRIEIYPDSVWAEYAAITRGRADWETILDRYKVDFLVLDNSEYHTELLPLVRRSPHWRQAFEQGHVEVFERVPAADNK